MPSAWNAPDVVARYIVARLKEECEPWGAVQRIADALGVAPPHLSNIKNRPLDQAKVSMPVAHRAAEMWGMSYEELEEEAKAGWRSRAAPERAPPSRPAGILLRDRPEWKTEVEAARRVCGDIPSAILDELIERAGEFYDPSVEPINAWWIAQWVRLLYERRKSSGAFPAMPGPPTSRLISKPGRKQGGDG